MRVAGTFSAIIPLYNKEGMIARAVHSILSQTCAPLEIIVVDDGSTDRGPEEVAEIAASVKCLRLVRQANMGEGAARNRGIREMRSNWGAFLDADDIWLDHHLEQLTQLHELFPSASILATALYLWRSNMLFYHSRLSIVTPTLVDNYFTASLQSPYWLTSSSIAICKSAVERCGYFIDRAKAGVDTEYWVRAGLNCEIGYHPCPSAVYFWAAPNSALQNAALSPPYPLAARTLLKSLQDQAVEKRLLASATEYAIFLLQRHASALLSIGDRINAQSCLDEITSIDKVQSPRTILLQTCLQSFPGWLLRLVSNLATLRGLMTLKRPPAIERKKVKAYIDCLHGCKTLKYGILKKMFVTFELPRG